MTARRPCRLSDPHGGMRRGGDYYGGLLLHEPKRSIQGLTTHDGLVGGFARRRSFDRIRDAGEPAALFQHGPQFTL